MIRLTSRIAIDESEIHERFVRASGPGGQNVNKVSTAVELRFNVRESPSLPPKVKERLERLAARRISADGVLVIHAQRFRSQKENRDDALRRLAALVEDAAREQAPRVPTRPGRGPREKRIRHKRRRSEIKSMRGRVRGSDE